MTTDLYAGVVGQERALRNLRAAARVRERLDEWLADRP